MQQNEKNKRNGSNDLIKLATKCACSWERKKKSEEGYRRRKNKIKLKRKNMFSVIANSGHENFMIFLLLLLLLFHPFGTHCRLFRLEFMFWMKFQWNFSEKKKRKTNYDKKNETLFLGINIKAISDQLLYCAMF